MLEYVAPHKPKSQLFNAWSILDRRCEVRPDFDFNKPWAKAADRNEGEP
jgi:hypothetical protein